MNKLNLSDMKTVQLSIDQVGKVLFYKDRIFRAISNNYINHVRNMFDCGLMKELISKKLYPETWISDVAIEGYTLILEHKKIDYWNYPYEWSFDMLKDAGLVILKVNNIANKYGYQLSDSHSSNVVFNMNKPQYIDLGSFDLFDKSKNTSWKSYTIFYNHFYIPLYLWSKGYPDIGRNIFLMMGYFDENEFLKLKYPIINIFDDKYIFKSMKMLRDLSLASEKKITDKLGNGVKQKFALFVRKVFQNKFSIEKLEKEIISFNAPLKNSMWKNYHNNIDPKSSKRFLRIIEIINSLSDAKTLIELASNQGKFASYVIENTQIEKLIATDYDKEAINVMYLNNRDRDNFLPLLFDMVRTNGRMYDEYMHKRINCDIVMALAVTHHLILTQNIPIDNIFKILKKLTKQYVIVEFMPMGLYDGDIHNTPNLPKFYNLNWFKKNFMLYFDLLLEENIDVNRHIFVGSLKNFKGKK